MPQWSGVVQRRVRRHDDELRQLRRVQQSLRLRANLPGLAVQLSRGSSGVRGPVRQYPGRFCELRNLRHRLWRWAVMLEWRLRVHDCWADVLRQFMREHEERREQLRRVRQGVLGRANLQ